MGPMQCVVLGARTDVLLTCGFREQERRLRLFLCVCVAVYRLEPRRAWHDVHHRPWERYCEFQGRRTYNT